MSWPQLSQPMQAAIKAIKNGNIGNVDPAKFHVRRKQFIHFQAWGDAGFTSKQFFNTGPQDFVCNTVAANQLCNTEQFFIMTHVGVAHTIAGSAGQHFDAATDPQLVAEFERQIYEPYNARLFLKVGSRVVLDDYGLCRFPAGGGADMRGAFENTNSTVVNQFASARNGAPLADNRYSLRVPFDIFPGKAVECFVYCRAAIAEPSNVDCTLCVEFDGILIEPANQ